MIRVTVYKNIKIGVSLGIYWTERDGKRGFGIPLDAPGTDFREVPRESPEMVLKWPQRDDHHRLWVD